MDLILAFLIEHWLLSSAFVAVLLLLILNEWRYRSFGLKAVGSQELVSFINHKDGVVIDTRANPQYEQGHILGALHIPADDLAKRLTTLNKYKNKPLILVCEAGIESPKVGKLLTENGFTQLYYLVGGMATWRSEGLPIQKK